MPDSARAVIVGGGIVGTSVAYHLTRLGWRDVVLLEQGSLSGGTTWHAAGLVGQLRSSSNLTRLIRGSVDLYRRLEAETGQSTGWKQCGSVSVARSAERMIQLRRNASVANAYGIEAHVISREEAARRYPLMRTDDLVGRFTDDRFAMLLRRLDSGLGRLIAEKMLTAANDCVTQLTSGCAPDAPDAGRVQNAPYRIRMRIGLAGSGLARPPLRELLGSALDAVERARKADVAIASDLESRP